MITETVVDVSNVSKTYPGTLALNRVSWTLRAGEIHALCGKNGSGKSTLIKILAGVETADPGGSIRVGTRSEASDAWSPAIAAETGVITVHQDLGLFPSMTVAENLQLGRQFPMRLGAISTRRLRRRAEELIDRFHIGASPETAVGELNRPGQTQIAIARALQDLDDTHRGVLILDEPTSALAAPDVNEFFGVLRRYAASGLSIVFVSHRIDEVLDVCDRVTVLRDGSLRETVPTEGLTESALVHSIVGHDVAAQERSAEKTRRRSDRPVIEVRSLEAGPLKGVDLDVYRGEVVGVAGLLGSGRTELLRALNGDLPFRGSVKLDGVVSRITSPQAALNSGIAMVAESRSESVFYDLSVAENIGVSFLPRYRKAFWISRSSMRRHVAALVNRYGVKVADVGDPASSLSGGNQQKVVIARALESTPRLLLLDEPSQGVDVGARDDIYGLVREAADRGTAVLVVASDFEELASVVDRAVVLRDGLLHPVESEDLSPHRLTELSYPEES